MADLSNYQPLYPDDTMPDPTTLPEAIQQINDLKDEMARLGNVTFGLHKKESEIERVLNELETGTRTWDATLRDNLIAYIQSWPADDVSIPYFTELEAG